MVPGLGSTPDKGAAIIWAGMIGSHDYTYENRRGLLSEAETGSLDAVLSEALK